MSKFDSASDTPSSRIRVEHLPPPSPTPARADTSAFWRGDDKGMPSAAMPVSGRTSAKRKRANCLYRLSLFHLSIVLRSESKYGFGDFMDRV